MHRDDHIIKLLKGEFDLDIPNFKKWNPDTRHRRTWFALSVDWYNDPKIRKLTDFQRALWLALVTFRACSAGPLRSVGVGYVNSRAGFRGGPATSRGLLKLWELGLIDLRCVSLQTIQDKQDRQQQTPEENTAVENKKKEDFVVPPPGPGGGPFLEKFEPEVRAIITRYQVTERGLEIWSGKWGVERVARNLIRASEEFENGANLHNPSYRNNFVVYFKYWMDNRDAKIAAGNLRKEKEAVATALKKEEEQWKAY